MRFYEKYKPAGVSAVTRSSIDAPNREQRYLIVFILQSIIDYLMVDFKHAQI